MIFLFLVDPLQSLNLVKDTSYPLMQEVQRRGHTIFVVYKDGVYLKKNQLFFNVIEIEINSKHKYPFIITKELVINSKEIDVIMIRLDPPFDSTYLTLTWLFDFVSDNTLMINSALGIRKTNEKICAHHFPEITPPTIITSHIRHYHDFLNKYQKVVVKPLNGLGGQGIFIVDYDDSNKNVIFETSSENNSAYVVVQHYIEASKEGDKRILLLDGKPLGAILRKHSSSDHRNNFFAGGTPHLTEITQHDKHIIRMIKPYLLVNGLHFVGIDIMGKYLIEINVTSPTGLQEINLLEGLQLETDILKWIENHTHFMAQ